MWVGRITGVYQHVKHLRIKAKMGPANLEANNQYPKEIRKTADRGSTNWNAECGRSSS